MFSGNHKRNTRPVLGSGLILLATLTISPGLLWFLMGAAQEAGVDPRLIYQNYSELGYAGGYQLSLWLITATLLYFASFLFLESKKFINVASPWLVTGGISIALSITMVIATVVLYRTSDGTEKIGGRELEAAKFAVQAARDRDLGPLHMPWKYRVTAVHKSTELNKCVVPQKADGPDDLSYYSATIEGVWLFGIHETFEQSLCQF